MDPFSSELPTVRQVIYYYLAHATDLEPRGLAERVRLLGLFCAIHGDTPVAKLRGNDLRAWLDANPQWVSNWTRCRIIMTLNRPFNFAVREGILVRNPFRGVTAPQGEPGEPMTDQEYRSLLRNTDACFRRLLLFLRYSGARPGEAAALEWEHLDLARACFRLAKHKTAKSRRDRKPRVIVLHPVVLRLLVWLKRNQPSGRYVFVNTRKTPWRHPAISMRLRKVRKRAGVRAACHLYGLRHKYGTQAILNHVDLATLAELMGHSKISTTLRYVHLAGETKHLQTAVGQIMKHGNPP